MWLKNDESGNISEWFMEVKPLKVILTVFHAFIIIKKVTFDDDRKCKI